MRTIHVRKPEEVSGLLAFVHDCAFELDAIKFNTEQRILSLPVEIRISKESKLLGIPIRRKDKAKAALHIRNVITWRISEDKARIGYGDINRILVEGNTLLIEGALPVNVEVTIAALDLELIAPDELTAS